MSYKSAMKKLNEVNVGVGGQANIQFSNIDQRFRHLRLYTQIYNDSLADQWCNLQFNGDIAANYDYESLDFSGATTAFSGAAGQTSIQVQRCTGILSGSAGSGCIDIVNYVGTTFHKTVQVQQYDKNANVASNTSIRFRFGTWRSTAAITSILLFPASGNFVQGSVASLYGIL